MSRFFARLLIIVLAASLMIFALPLHAQQDRLPKDQRALVERAIRAVEATQNYTSFVSHLDQTLADSSQVGEAPGSFSDRRYTISRDSFFTLDAAGEPNIQSLQTLDFAGESSAWEIPHRYTLTSEIRVVGALVYVRAKRESAQEAILPQMPPGWLIAQSSAHEWAALDALSLDEWINAPDEQRIFDLNIPLLLQESSGAALESITLDDGTPADRITLTINGADLRRGMAAYVEAQSGGPNSTVYYGSIDLTSTWMITFTLNETDQVVAFEIEGHLRWTDFDLNFVSPLLDPGTLMNQEYDMMSAYTIRDINAPLAPISAPEVEREEIYGLF
ncbi:MAG: hypothetical protein HY866_07445 [Chloroflexi bacterium]|nr:hypothetical protein [Chloroflexota bacterium]